MNQLKEEQSIMKKFIALLLTLMLAALPVMAETAPAGWYEMNENVLGVHIPCDNKNGETVAAAIKKAMPLFYWFGKACVNSELSSIALLAVTAIVPFILGCLLISKSFIRIATTKKC